MTASPHPPRLTCRWCSVAGDRIVATVGERCAECGRVVVDVTDEAPYGTVLTMARGK